MKIAYVPASAIMAEPGTPLIASAYIQPSKQQEQRITTAKRLIRQGNTAIADVARQRLEISMRQARLGIVEIES